jgi:hypothetical protein
MLDEEMDEKVFGKVWPPIQERRVFSQMGKMTVGSFLEQATCMPLDALG